MDLIVPLSSPHPLSVDHVGGKGKKLMELARKGFTVPDGVVITTDVFAKFVEETGIGAIFASELKHVDAHDLRSMESVSQRLMSLVTRTALPVRLGSMILQAFKGLQTPYVAVRSSATTEDGVAAAWAGQLDTYLNTTEDMLLANVQRCWGSLFSVRALSYGLQQGLQYERISVAVILQRMVDSQCAGVAFSVHPVSQDRNQIIVEAAFGLGEGLVSGEITPDHYVIRKDSHEVVERFISEQTREMIRGKRRDTRWKKVPEERRRVQKIDDRDLMELSNIVSRIEALFGVPVDVEWAQRGRTLFVLQARPITTLQRSKRSITEHFTYEFSWAEKHIVLSAEAWPMSYGHFRHLLANEYQHMFQFVEHGYVHTYIAREERPGVQTESEKLLADGGLEQALRTSSLARRRMHRLYNTLKRTDLRRISDPDLSRLFRSYFSAFEFIYAAYKISQPEYLDLAKHRLESLLRPIVADEQEMQNLFIVLTTPLEMDCIKEEEVVATRLSLRATLSTEAIWQHAEAYPWFFFNTFDRSIVNRFWNVRFDELRATPAAERREFLRRARRELREHQQAHVLALQRVHNDPRVVRLANIFGALANDRLKVKSWWAGCEFLFLPMFEEIARRSGLSLHDLLFAYRAEDILRLILEKSPLPDERVANRLRAYALLLDGSHVHFFEGEEAVQLHHQLVRREREASPPSRECVRGIVANTGRARGTARLIRVEGLETLLKDLERFNAGDILVTTMTQPSMVSLARKAGAIVTNEGGITSHASVLAREFDIPCIVGTKHGTEVIREGDVVDVDAFTGEVRVVQAA